MQGGQVPQPQEPRFGPDGRPIPVEVQPAPPPIQARPQAPALPPSDLVNAPTEWISEVLPPGSSSGLSARLSFSPPAIRVEQCKATDKPEDCAVLLAGMVLDLSSDRGRLRSKDGREIDFRWKIVGGKQLTLAFDGQEMRFRPGRKQELLKLLAR